MKVKLPLQTLAPLFDNPSNLYKAYPQLRRMGLDEGILFAEITVGNGYLEWDLPGEGWQQFDKASEAEKSDVAEIYEERKNKLLTRLQGSFLHDFVCNVPSPEFIYYKGTGNAIEIALVAWGYRYPDRAPSGELQTFIHKKDLQDARFGFEWDGQMLPSVAFNIEGLQRQTSSDGFFYFDKKLPVGNTYTLTTEDGGRHTFRIEKGRKDYVANLTKYFFARMKVTKGDNPLGEADCEVEYEGKTHTLKTDSEGIAEIKLPLNCDITGQISSSQPECKVSCDGETQSKHPSGREGEKLDYQFNFDPPVIPEPPSEDIVVVPPPPEPEKEKKKRKFPWWIFLCLLPLLLLIKCKKDVEVTVVEPESQIEIANMDVNLDYNSHFIWNDGRFFPKDSISRTARTDSTGKAVFKDLPCSVYSYIFYSLSKMKIGAKNECHQAREDLYNFHYRKKIKMETEPRREDLHVKLLDLETEDPLPDGRLIYKYLELDEERTDTAQANPEGVVTIPGMRYCGDMELLLGQSYGYADTTKTSVPSSVLIVPSDSTALRLRPLKERFTFFVKNEDTKEPIPGAICEVVLTHPSGKQEGPNTVTTSTDGKGIAIYEDSFVLSVINITAHKEHFRDSVLTGGPWTVEKFIIQDDSTRTIWLKPLPYVQEFVNVDSITGKPIPGVSNKIRVTDVDGTTREFEEISNSNGVFPVEAKEDSKVEIISQKGPEYYDKKTDIAKFKDTNEKKIRMRPEMVTLKFRTVNANNPNTLVPQCALQVTGTISGSLPPNNSGNGEFEVSFRRVESITIRASRKNWVTTTDKVNNKNYEYLKVDQERRDIPLKQNLPPCSAGNVITKESNQKYHEKTYAMGIEEGNAAIWVDFHGVPDHLTLIDGEGRVLIDKDIKNQNEGGPNPIPFHFKGASVTVKVTTNTSTNLTSNWDYRLICPK